MNTKREFTAIDLVIGEVVTAVRTLLFLLKRRDESGRLFSGVNVEVSDGYELGNGVCERRIMIRPIAWSNGMFIWCRVQQLAKDRMWRPITVTICNLGSNPDGADFNGPVFDIRLECSYGGAGYRLTLHPTASYEPSSEEVSAFRAFNYGASRQQA